VNRPIKAEIAEMMKRSGLILIALSYIKWAVIPFVHLFPVSMAWKGAIYAGLVIGSEMVFWIGISIVGIESFRRIFNGPVIALPVTGKGAAQND
jgi:hypothetical protein